MIDPGRRDEKKAYRSSPLLAPVRGLTDSRFLAGLGSGMVLDPMTICESDLEQQLLGDDDEVAHSTLRRYFRPMPRRHAPMFFDWVPMPDLVVVLGGGQGGCLEQANAADAALRRRRFERRRLEHPDWPVVVCEGDSWISHPFLDDIGDQLFDDDLNSFLVLNRGAAGDRLATVAAEREHETVLDEVDAAAMVLSGGGNDLLVQFGEFLRSPPHPGGDDPSRLVTEELEVRLEQLMTLMRRVLRGVRAKDATLPILVHGYDYLQVDPPRRGKFLGPYFDRAGIPDPERQDTLDAIVDRFNEVLAPTLASVPGVFYVDVRGTVQPGEWHDEIHPDDVGFRRLADVLGEVVRDRMRPHRVRT